MYRRETDSERINGSNERVAGRSMRRQPASVNPLGIRCQALLVLALCALTLGACRQRMAEQPGYDPLEPSAFFADGQSARHPVPNTVPRGGLQADELLYTGSAGGAPADTFPFTVTLEVLERGRERYDIFCSPCHDRIGTGNGLIVQRGFTPPPTLHSDRLRAAPAGHFFAVITNGFGAMPSYAPQIPALDRWRSSPISARCSLASMRRRTTCRPKSVTICRSRRGLHNHE